MTSTAKNPDHDTHRRLAGLVAALLVLASVTGCAGATGSVAESGQSTSTATATATAVATTQTATPDASPSTTYESETATAEATDSTVDADTDTDTDTSTDTDTDTSTDTDTTADDSSSVLGTYSGTATVTLTTYDYCGGQFGGERREVGTQTYTLPGRMILDRPKSDGTMQESNSFDLMLDLGTSGSAGSFALGSALTVAAPGGSLLLQYWNLGGDASSFSGTLEETHRAEAAAANQFWGVKLIIACRPSMGNMPPMPSAISAGARLSGHADGSSGDLSLAGATDDGNFEFTVDFQS